MPPNRRLRMKQWLTILLDKGDTPGIQWEDEKNAIFKINWKHGSRHGFTPDRDALVFKKWAEYTGKFDSRGSPDPKRWKANFRCALNSLKDVRQLTGKYNRGAHAFRLYQFVNHAHVIRRQPIKTEHFLEFNPSCQFQYNNDRMSMTSPTVIKKELPFYQSIVKQESICSSPEVLTPPHTPEDVIYDTTTNHVDESIFTSCALTFSKVLEQTDMPEENASEFGEFARDFTLDILENCNTALVNFNEFEEFFPTVNEAKFLDCH